VAREYSRFVLFKANNAIERIYDLSKLKNQNGCHSVLFGDPLAWKDGTITFLEQKKCKGK
jgi:hypothetical protein